MSEWNLGSGFRSETFGTSSGTTSHGGTTVTSSGSVDTKGSWTQIAASTSFDAAAIYLNLDTAFTDTNYLLDIGVGAAASETILIPDVMIAAEGGKGVFVTFPVTIPAGSRIAARCAANFASSGMFVSVTLFSASFVDHPSGQNVTAYGVVTSGSKGTTVNAGGVANTKGSWTQITASTTRDHKGLIVGAERPVLSVIVAGGYSQLTDIGVGGAGSEQILVPDIRFQSQAPLGTTSPRGQLEPSFIALPACDIPAGSRLAVRQQSTSIDAEDRTAAYVLYGLG
jgi:hypothetical protein